MSGGAHFSWTVGALEDLRAFNRIDGDLKKLAHIMGCTSQDVDRALWFLLGRSPEEALEAMHHHKMGACA